MKYAGKTVYIVVNEGELIGTYEDGGKAWGIANSINDENTLDEVMEAGYESEELTDDEMSEFEVAAGFYGGWAYSEEIDIPEERDAYDEDSEEYEEDLEERTVCTSHGDVFTYEEIIQAMDEYL
ncbi:MAG: hypothetical protein HFI31_16815 [Lachnospiraceae bacterium]|nr:hypothetical protein [Lachnospiraceae bacterium]